MERWPLQGPINSDLNLNKKRLSFRTALATASEGDISTGNRGPMF
jgi:hypothetical protein